MTIYDERNVPILFRGPGERIGFSAEMYEIVQKAHEAAQQALEEASKAVHAASRYPDSEAYAEAREHQAAVIEEHLLIGDAVVIDNPDTDKAPYTLTSIGASDLKEAVQDSIGGFDLGHIGEDGVTQDHIFTPEYVASTNRLLAEALADYYSCQIRELNEVLV